MALLAQTSTQQLVTSSITAVNAQFQTLSTLTFNVSSINGIVPGAAFSGSTTALSTGLITASNVTMSGALNMNTNPISNAGTITESTYISNMVAWFDGNDSTTLFQDGGGTSPVTANNQNVYLWKDKSPYKTNATPYVGIPKSSYASQGSKNGVSFNANSGLSFSNTNMPGGSSSNATYFLVAKQAGTAGSLLVTTPLFGTGGSLLSTENNGGMQIYIGGVSPDGGASWSGNTPYIQTLVVQSNQITRRANGTQLNVTTFTSAVSANTSNAFISGFFGGGYNYWNGQVYEVLVYNSPLATLAMQQIEGYLAWKWGITLGAAHPYYAVSPGITPDPAGTLTQFASFGLDTANNLQITATNAIRLTAAVQIPTTLTTSSVTVSTINGSTLTQLITQPFQSTVQGLTQGLGAAGYISTAQLTSTVRGIGSGFTGSTLGLSAGTIGVSTINSVYLSSVQGYISSFRTDSLTVGGPTGYVTIQDLTTATISTGQIVAGAGFISSLQINTLSFGPSGYVIVGDVIANSLSTTRLNTQALYTNNLYVGNVSSQSAILFPGVDGNYRGTAVAERTTGTGTSELLLYKVSSTTDQIRLQTTGNMVFEVGAPSRSWNSTTQLATPSLYIQGSTSNVGIGTASPATTFDVIGTGRFHILSSLAFNVSSINVTNLSTNTLTTNSLTAQKTSLAGTTATFGGLTTSNLYGTNYDTLTLQAPVSGGGGGIVSMYMGTLGTLNYPFARIAAIGSASASESPASALLFQTTLPSTITTTPLRYPYSGVDQFFTVPANVTSLTVSLWGAGGGGNQYTFNGGGGAYVSGVLSVTAGQVLKLITGQGGSFNSSTSYGGGGASGSGNNTSGGGRSAIQLMSSNVVTGASSSGTAITYITNVAQTLQTGIGVIVSGLTTSAFNISGLVASVISPTSFTINSTATGATVSGGSGTLAIELVDAGAGGGAGFSGGAAFAGNGGLTTGGTGQDGNPAYSYGGTQSAGGGASAGTPIPGSIFTGGTPQGGTGGGGAGFFGGAGGTSSARAGGGGSSYTSYTGFTIVSSSAGNATTPVGTSDITYISGIGVGGIPTGTASGTGGPGGNGYIAIIPPTQNVLTETMRISKDGYLGIGTSSPQTLLHVSGTIYAISVSTPALTVSSINGAIPWQQFYLTSTVQGLGVAGYISSAQLTSTVRGLTQGLGSAGYISSAQLTSTVAGLAIVAANAFTGSTTSLSAGTIFVSSVKMNTMLISTMSMVDTTLVSTSGSITQDNLVLYFNTMPFAGTQAWFGQMIIPPGPPLTSIFSYTGASQTFVVPTSVNSINAYMWGAGGGGVATASGGAGAFIQAAVPVTPGETLTLIVGGGGGVASTVASFGGGGAGGGGGFGTQGGGRTAIQRGSIGATDYIVVGAGGGGSGYSSAGAGGAGGISAGSPAAGTTGLEGQGGTQSAGGAGTSGVISAGASGTLGAGGAAGAYGGGGGAGYYGGGGSGATAGVGASGGGGSSFVNNVVPIALTAGSGGTAPNTADQFYVAPVAAGGTSISGTGGNGLIVVSYTAAPPAAPSGLTLTLNGTTATLSWTSAGVPLYYWAFYGNSISAYTGTYLMSGSTAGTSVSYSLTATLFDYFRLVSLSPLGCISAIVSSPIVQVPAPSGLSLTAVGTTVTMSWSAVSGATSYTYTLSSNSSYAYSGSSVATATVGGTTATYSSGVSGTYYYFSVNATTPNGTSLSTTSGIVQGVPSFTATTFTYTGANQSYTVPSNSGLVNVYMWGAGGGGGSLSRGGAGAYLTGLLTVTPSETLTIIVGQGGRGISQSAANSGTTSAYGGGGAVLTNGNGNSYGNGGGGGRSAIQRSSADIVTVGAGGGTGLSSGPGYTNYSGGAGSYNGTGGDGGVPASGYYGKGGSTTAGGAAGGTNSSTAGSLNQGGSGDAWGGGGGSGYYGGGGGSDNGAFGSSGGGGGSSYTANLRSVGGANSTDGYSAPGTSVSYYQSGVAVGAYTGNVSVATAGGNGLVVVLPVSVASPTGLALTPAVGSTATLSWTPSAGATGYSWIVYQSATNGYFGTSFATGSTNSTTYTATVTGLNLTSYYYFTVIATGTPSSAAAVSAIMYELPDEPAAPTCTTSGTTVDMSWTAVAGARYYTYTVYQGSAYSYTGIQVATANNGNSLSATYAGIATNYYYFTVSVTTSAGTSALATSGIAQAVTLLAPTVTTFSATGADQLYTFPTNAVLTVYMWAAAGGGTNSINGNFAGGAGAYVQGTLVATGAQYTIIVGKGGVVDGAAITTRAYKNGGAALNNDKAYIEGGGGGRSGLQLAGVNLIAVGAGGGAGGSGNGGAGGITTGANGSGPSTNYGLGGSQSAGGAAGTGTYNTASPGTQFGGGNAPTNGVGGGGGDGYYGGGGGVALGADQKGGGGGGGSSLTSNLSSLVTFVSSNGYSAPNTSSPYYQAGIAAGSPYATGGDGLVVVSASTNIASPANPTLVSSGSSATMSWTASTSATSYSWILYQSATNAYAGSSFATGTTTSATTATATGLSLNSYYYFTVSATGAAGTSPAVASAIVLQLITGPATATLTVSATTLSLSWGAVAGATSYSYTIYSGAAYSYTGMAFVSTTSSATTSASYTGTAGTYYYFTVTATSASGTSGPTTSGIGHAVSILYTSAAASVTTLAGGNGSFADGTGTSAGFNTPAGVLLLPDGNIAVADMFYHRIRIVTPAGVVTTLAGSGNAALTDGTGVSASFNRPRKLALVTSTVIAVADYYGSAVRLLTYPGGVVTTLASGFSGCPGVAIDPTSGNLVATDQNNGTVSLVTYPGGTVTRIAGSTGGFADGTGTNARFNYPYGVAVLPTGLIVIGDYNNHRIRLISSAAAGVVTTLAGQTSAGSADGTGASASFSSPDGVAILPNGNIIVADSGNSLVRMVTSGGVVTTLSGRSGELSTPYGVALLANGNIVVADSASSRIKIIAFTGFSPPTLPTFSITTGTATLGWTAAAGATGYSWILYRSSTNAYNGTSNSTGTTTSAVTATVSSLSAGFFWYFTVTSTNGSATSQVAVSSIVAY